MTSKNLSIYRVRLSGENFTNVFDGREQRCGFVKNEYVWALNAESAAHKAEEKIREKVMQHPSLHVLDGEQPRFEVDVVESGASALKLLRDEGFVFYVDE